MWPNPQFPPDLVAFTEEILNGKLKIVYSALFILSDCEKGKEYLINCNLFAKGLN